MITKAKLLENIISKKQAAEQLKSTSPSEASYLAGYCLECFLKCAIGITGKYNPTAREQRLGADYPFKHRYSDLAACWALIRIQLRDPLFLDLSNKVINFGNFELASWQEDYRYDPDWKFADLDKVFQSELPEIAKEVDQMRLNFMGRLI